MNILVNATQPMTGILTGISRYLRNLYAVLGQMNQIEVAYFTGTNTEVVMPPMADPVRLQRVARLARKLPAPVFFGARSVQWLMYEHHLNRVCRHRPSCFSVYHETAFTPAKLTGVPTVFSIYDLSLRRYGHTHPKERVWLFEYFIKTRLRYAAHILTISEFIRQEIIDEFQVNPAMVTAVPLAPDPLFAPCNDDDVNSVRYKYNLPESYLLFAGSLEPRKNLDLLISALMIVQTDIPLVLVGPQGWGKKLWQEKIRGSRIKNRIFFTGHVTDQDLRALYTGAVALIYPSLYEGFGLPILEAMACGCPVVCSNSASMPEVAGDAAIMIDPVETEDLARAIDTLVSDTALRQAQAEKGMRRAAEFDWDLTAAKTLDVFRKVAL